MVSDILFLLTWVLWWKSLTYDGRSVCFKFSFYYSIGKPRGYTPEFLLEGSLRAMWLSGCNLQMISQYRYAT